jgi:hypothetical protein
MAETTPTMAQAREEFDRIAQLGDDGWDHNRHSSKPLTRQDCSRFWPRPAIPDRPTPS